MVLSGRSDGIVNGSSSPGLTDPVLPEGVVMLSSGMILGLSIPSLSSQGADATIFRINKYMSNTSIFEYSTYDWQLAVAFLITQYIRTPNETTEGYRCMICKIISNMYSNILTWCCSH